MNHFKTSCVAELVASAMGGAIWILAYGIDPQYEWLRWMVGSIICCDAFVVLISCLGIWCVLDHVEAT